MRPTPHSFPRLCALLLSLAACSDPAPSDPAEPRPVHVIGQVRDSDGGPVPEILVTWEAWPSPDPHSPSVYGAGRTDQEGHFTAELGDYDIDLLDSLVVTIGGDDCWGFAPLEVRRRDLEIAPGRADTAAALDVTLQRTATNGRLAVGTVCAAIPAEDYADLVSENHLTLWIDEVGDSVRGRWDITYAESRGDDWGRFVGALEGSSLVLELRHEEPWGTCTAYTIEIPVAADGSFGAGSYSSEGCSQPPTRLRFVEGAHREWPFD